MFFDKSTMSCFLQSHGAPLYVLFSVDKYRTVRDEMKDLLVHKANVGTVFLATTSAKLKWKKDLTGSKASCPISVRRTRSRTIYCAFKEARGGFPR